VEALLVVVIAGFVVLIACNFSFKGPALTFSTLPFLPSWKAWVLPLSGLHLYANVALIQVLAEAFILTAITTLLPRLFLDYKTRISLAWLTTCSGACSADCGRASWHLFRWPVLALLPSPCSFRLLAASFLAMSSTYPTRKYWPTLFPWRLA